MEMKQWKSNSKRQNNKLINENRSKENEDEIVSKQLVKCGQNNLILDLKLI